MVGFGALADLTLCTIPSYIPEDTWPPVVPGDKLMDFVLAWVSCKVGIMALANYIFSQPPIHWNICILVYSTSQPHLAPPNLGSLDLNSFGLPGLGWLTIVGFC